MMLLTHCYHGSIVFGLEKSSMNQCRQLLELALIAEEYLCPSLLMECELRLLMKLPFLEKHEFSPCICPQCSSGVIQSSEQLGCPIGVQCLEEARSCLDDCYCELAGVYFYSCFVSSNENGGIITPETVLDVFATAQQLEESLCHHEFYRTEFHRLNKIYGPNPTDGPAIPSEYTFPPFAAVKLMAVRLILQDFQAVIRSESYMRQIKSDDDNDDSLTREDPLPQNDKYAIFLLQTCLSCLQSSRKERLS
jgi:hypothetical protein